jgi:hypothetical protein
MQRHSVVEPVRKGGTNDQEFLEESRDSPSNTRGAVLSHVYWSDARHASNPETGDEATTIDLANMVKRCDLDNGTEHENNCESQKRPLATELVVEDGGKYGAKEATCCEQGNNILGDVCVCLAGKSSGSRWQSEIVFEALQGENRAHNTGVISCVGA